MKVLILGGTGMLGHKLWQVLSGRLDTFVTIRGSLLPLPSHHLLPEARTLENIAAEDLESVGRALDQVQPHVVVNCIGIVKQRTAGKEPLPSIAINAYFPHRLAALCRARGSRLIHISTDCVFSGMKGNYTEDDTPDPVDLYGRTKLLGELNQSHCLTVRTSMIGRELGSAYGLVEWFLRQEGKTVSGYQNALFSGLTTQALAAILLRVIEDHPRLHGLWHIASTPISKYDLLGLIRSIHRLNVVLQPDAAIRCDRSLDGSRFQQATGITPPGWIPMIEEMAA
ncbi:NAD(P)-dependent oxidoreductase [Planctomycetaceae bacterium SCGC AG-212-F19]|nr:NAD(P)-dependent oxidoreductase [Planctomycetaceae bacterium SCGC AG-212-F19]